MPEQPPKITVTDLERFTTHELGDLLGNIILILKRLPDVPVSELSVIVDEASSTANGEEKKASWEH